MMNLATVIVSFVSGLLGSMGFGGGTVLILYLTLFSSVEQKAAQGINLFFFLPYALYSVIIYKKSGLIKKENVLSLIFYGIVGICVGLFVLSKIDSYLLTKLFGVFLILLGLREMFSKKSEANKKEL